MNIRYFWVKTAGFVAGAILLGASLSVQAKNDWPNHPIRIIQPFAAGGPGDLAARMFAFTLSNNLGTSLIMENRPGAGGIIGSAFVAHSKPDGYTFLLAGNGSITTFLLHKDMPYTQGDLVPVAMIDSAPAVIVVNPETGIKNLKDLQAYAQRHGALTFADAGIGSTGHFVGGLLDATLDIPITAVHYKSGGESLLGVMDGQVVAAAEGPIAVLPNIQAGRLTPIAVASDTRLDMFPDVPTTAEQGFPSLRMEAWTGMFAAKGTPAAVLDRMVNAIDKTSADPKVKAKLAASGYRVFRADRVGFQSFIEDERKRLSDLAAKVHMPID